MGSGESGATSYKASPDNFGPIKNIANKLLFTNPKLTSRNRELLAALYLFGYIVLLFAGPGKIIIDKLIGK